MKSCLLILACLVTFSVCLNKLELKQIQTPEEVFKYKFFSHEFNKHNGDLKSFLRAYKGSKFLLNHIKEIKEIYRTYRLFRGSSTGIHQTGIQDSPFLRAFYYSEIDIGTPAQKFRVNIDAGSADLWVPAYNCTGCEGHNKYYYNESSTYQSDNDTSFLIEYGGIGRFVQGFLVKDDVSLAGLEVKGQTFAIADNNLAAFYIGPQYKYDGILGMGFPALANSHATPFMFNLKAQGQISENVWSYHLITTYENLSGKGSEIVIGGVDKNYYTGNFTYHKVLNIQFQGLNGFWVIEGGLVDFGGVNNAFHVDRFGLDTGNNDAFDIPFDINPTLPNVNSNCDGIENLPTIKITLGDYTYSLESNFYVYKINDANIGDQCTLLIEQFAPWLGIGFVNKYYTRFDYDNQTLGFALNKI